MIKLYVVVLITLAASATSYGKQKWTTKRETHRYNTLTPSRLGYVANLPKLGQSQFSTYLDTILLLRPPNSEGLKQVRQNIIKHLEELGGWKIELDAFDVTVKNGEVVEFVNIVATLNPDAKRRLVLACHYDSKYFPPDPQGREFLGATDSAVPCAMMLDLAYQLGSLLKESKDKDITLQLMFFDGEEAYNGKGAVAEWGSSNNLYGSRHLAQKYEKTLHPLNNPDKTNLLDGIDVLILLDLIGHSEVAFVNHYAQTSVHFQRMQNIENRLKSNKLLTTSKNHHYFQGTSRNTGVILDDHIPFVERGVPALHLISTPFPRAWHRFQDNRDIIDEDSVENLSKILRIYVVEYLGLNIPPNKK